MMTVVSDPLMDRINLNSYDSGGIAIIFGASGGIGRALLETLTSMGHFKRVLGFSSY